MSSTRVIAPIPPSLQEQALLRLPQVLSIVPLQRAAWLDGVAKGRYPKPVKIGPRVVAWRSQDIAALIADLKPTP